MSWLPNFSVEVTHINAVLREHPIAQTAAHTSQIRSMGRQVQQMFPRYPISVIIADLQLSRSMEITIDNILEGRLQIPARFQTEFEDADEFGETTVQQTGGIGSPIGNNDDGNVYASTLSSPNDYYVNPADFATGSSSSDSGYEIERNSNIFGNQNELLRDDRFVQFFSIYLLNARFLAGKFYSDLRIFCISSEDIPLGDRFSKSSTEREKILQRRKEMLLAIARKRYVFVTQCP